MALISRILKKRYIDWIFHFVWLLTTTAVQPDTAVYSCTRTARSIGYTRVVDLFLPRAIYKGDDWLVHWGKKSAAGGFFPPVYKIAYVGGPRLKVPVVLLFGRESVSLPVNPCLSPGRYCCSSSAAARLPNRDFFGSGAITGEWSIRPRSQKCDLSRFTQPFFR